MRNEQLISHPRFNVNLQVGTEGPRHDPYSYRELHVDTPLGKTILHQGLGVWLKHDGKSVTPESILGPKLAKALDWAKRDSWYLTMFSALVGYTPTQIERIATRLNSRCKKCGSREFECVSGYPGETFSQCVKCKHINSSSMDYSAIE